MGFSLGSALAVDLGATVGGAAATAGGIAGSAVVGAGLGAGLSAATGGNPLTGAEFGGISGGIGGAGGAIGGAIGGPTGAAIGDVAGGVVGGALGGVATGSNPLTGALEGGATGALSAGVGALSGGGPGQSGGGGGTAPAPIGGADAAPVDLTNLGGATGGVDAAGNPVPSVFTQPNVTGIGTPSLAPQFNIGTPQAPAVGGTGLPLDQIAGGYGSNVPATPAGPQGTQGQFGAPSGGGLFGQGGILGTGIGNTTPTSYDVLDPNNPINLSPPGTSGAGSPASPGGGGTSGASGFSLTDPSTWLGAAGSAIAKNPLGAAVAGGGLLYNLLTGSQATKGLSQLTGEAGNLLNQSSQLQSYLQSGNLPPGLQETISNATAAAKAQVRGTFASMGLSGSTQESTALSQVDANAVSQTANIGESLLTTGINEARLADNLLEGVISINQKQAATTGSAIANLAAALAGGGSAGGITLKLAGTQGNTP